MSFVVDGSDWLFDGWDHNEIHGWIEALLEFVENSRVAEQTIWIGEDLQSKPMLNGHDLWTIASRGGMLGLPSEVVQELTAWLMRAPLYLDEPEWPDDFDDTMVSIAHAAQVDNPDVAWAHHSVRAGRPVGCLSLRRSGKIATSTAAGEVGVFWVRNETDRVYFWRDAIEMTGDSEENLVSFANWAFPQIYFYDGALHGLRRLAGGYLAIRDEVKRTLAVLNDYAVPAFSAAPVTNQNIQTRFRGFGIDAAPENPNVYLDGHCRRAREVEIGGITLYCEWHVKLEPHRNRIHVHAPIEATGGRVIVAIIHEHLPLP
ncbi:hypothetical protein [Ensifer adhaerens]|uniref:hypothetical protein n=1 Tax=Ensifer adhaerens TaxID=106592 RepID=UPI00132F2A68|nr:hypothetical protein [Ensifer adhaerens]QHG74437.1 hypothetical protein DQW09_32125 [Ensifer adhaerens]